MANNPVMAEIHPPMRVAVRAREFSLEVMVGHLTVSADSMSHLAAASPDLHFVNFCPKPSAKMQSTATQLPATHFRFIEINSEPLGKIGKAQRIQRFFVMADRTHIFERESRPKHLRIVGHPLWRWHYSAPFHSGPKCERLNKGQLGTSKQYLLPEFPTTFDVIFAGKRLPPKNPFLYVDAGNVPRQKDGSTAKAVLDIRLPRWNAPPCAPQRMRDCANVRMVKLLREVCFSCRHLTPSFQIGNLLATRLLQLAGGILARWVLWHRNPFRSSPCLPERKYGTH
nr:hypothetical protein OH820_15155 [Streptomyces sp. NBC_00857]